ncbi:carboxylesterase NlhH [mine drainage metagenome]|uniref:Carboxylesterase NlhH n=1 Tax=mine drainage metagenome TaxID=410659 RepID=A0A1J5RDI2_9ZZZZ
MPRHHETSEAALAPAMGTLLERIARAGAPPLWTLGVDAARAFHRVAAGVLEVAPPALHEVVDLDCPTRDGSRLALRRYRARPQDAHAQAPALLYLHGGGFVLGDLDSHDVLCRRLALLGECTVFALDYRLAPEHRFPTAVDDTWDALQWLREHAAWLGVDAQRIALGGDSAGGTLATVAALQARDAGFAPALQLLFYPGTAGWAHTVSAQRYAHGYLLEREHLDWFFGHYLGALDAASDWRFAPLLAPDLRGVAPAWIGLAGCDPLRDEGRLYAQRLRDAGVPVQLDEWPGVTHDFIRMGRALPQAGAAVAAAAAALRAAWSAAPRGANPRR